MRRSQTPCRAGLTIHSGPGRFIFTKNGRDTYFRIHGTTDPGSIGQSELNGCIRMLNDQVKPFYDQVPVGNPVTVL